MDGEVVEGVIAHLPCKIGRGGDCIICTLVARTNILARACHLFSRIKSAKSVGGKYLEAKEDYVNRWFLTASRLDLPGTLGLGGHPEGWRPKARPSRTRPMVPGLDSPEKQN